MIPILDERFKDQVEGVADLILSEVNIKAIEYLTEVLHYDLACLDPALGADACTDAISLGLPLVGVPYSFGPMADGNGNYDPYQEDALWWQADLMVAVADRTALIRPSLNPTVAPSTAKRFTADGRPVWGKDGYRRPESGDAIYEAVLQKLDDPEAPFVGWINDCDYTQPPRRFEGSEGYWKWLELWRSNSWFGPHDPDQFPPDESSRCGGDENHPYDQFPYSGLGLTLNWTEEVGGKTLPDAFYALSEFIHVGEQPIYIVGVYQGSQLLGGGLPGSGQRPWYESCNGDFNLDGIVDGRDLAILLSQWFDDDAPVEIEPNVCLNIDKLAPKVGPAALIELLERWGACPEWPIPELDPSCP